MFIARLRNLRIPFTYLVLCPVRQLPMAMTRIFPFLRVPRHVGSAEIRAPFLFAPTLVTWFRRRTTLLTTRIWQRLTLSICPVVLCMAVNVLGRRLLSAVFLVRCPPHLSAPLCNRLLASRRTRDRQSLAPLISGTTCPILCRSWALNIPEKIPTPSS